MGLREVADEAEEATAGAGRGLGLGAVSRDWEKGLQEEAADWVASTSTTGGEERVCNQARQKNKGWKKGWRGEEED